MSIFKDFPTLDPLKLGEYPASEVWYLINMRNKYYNAHKDEIEGEQSEHAQHITNKKENRTQVDPRDAAWL